MSGNLLKEVIASGEDFEWYPTTKEIIYAMHNDMVKQSHNDGAYHPCGSFLDIGAGNGKVFRTIEKLGMGIDSKDKFTILDKYAIEKSTPLLNALDNEVFIVGTDFLDATLIDKEVDIAFSNPPYSEFESWTCKIIKEANAKFIYLVIPQRWENNQAIQESLKERKAVCETIGKFDFENSEDRKARAKVSLLKINLKKNKGGVDPFDIWFNTTYKFDEKKR